MAPPLPTENTPFIQKEEGDSSSSPTHNYDPTDGVLLFALCVLLEVLGLISVVLVCVWTKSYLGGFAWDGSGKMFNWHPVLMSVAVLLYGNAAICYRVLRKTDKFRAKLVHGGINISVFVLVVIALVAVFGFHNHNKIPNVYSLHSWVGITAVVLYGCQLLFGFLGFLYPKFSDNGRRIYLRVHVYFGAIILALFIIACISGFTEKLLFSKIKYALLPAPGMIANLAGVSIIAFGMIVGYVIHNPDWKRVD